MIQIYLIFLGRMSDHDQSVRMCATHSFATLIQLMPLDGGVPDPPHISSEFAKHKQAEKQFLGQLFNPKSIADFKIPVPINAQLRSYQQVQYSSILFVFQYYFQTSCEMPYFCYLPLFLFRAV